MRFLPDCRHPAALKRVLVALGLLAALATAACQPTITNPPRVATSEALAAGIAEAIPETLYIPAPTPTNTTRSNGTAGVISAPVIDVWVNETSEEHRAVLQSMAADFNSRTNIDVAFQFIDPKLLPDLAATAVISGTLPDIIVHPLEYTVSWSEAGILDPGAADVLIDEIGRDSFDSGALNLVDINGRTAAVPSEGYKQLLLYRSDWFTEKQLEIPDNYRAMMTGAGALFDPDNLISGIVIPTESNLATTHKAFEHLAIANNCQLVQDSGEIMILDASCRSALDFYFDIVNQYSPPGVQTDTSARNAFLDGRTAMIITSPDILTDLVRANRMDRNTGLVTAISGAGSGSEPANFGNITYLGITPEADDDAAAAFVNYWFNEGYQAWLEVDSERKVPMRLGTSDRPRFYIDAWGNQQVLEGESLNDIFGREAVDQMREGIGTTKRWGFEQGQGALLGRLYEELTFSVVLQEMLSGYFNSDKTIFEAYSRVIDLIPNYKFTIVPTPEA